MEFDAILDKRRSCRAYTSQRVERELSRKLIDAAIKAPVSCNLQATQFIILDDQDILRQLSDLVSYKFSYAPCYVLVVYDPRVTVERASVISSSAMAAENIILKAVDLGLATCPMAGFAKDEVIKKILKIPSEMSLLLLIAVGYQDTAVKQIDIPKVIPKSLYAYNTYDGLQMIDVEDDLDRCSPESIADYRRRIGAVYLDRFRLQTWSVEYYHEVLNFINQQLQQAKSTRRVLDLLSHDGYFLKVLHESDIKDVSIATSDYVEEHLEFLKEKFDCVALKINNKNEIEKSSHCFNVITNIFQVEFTPRPENLYSSAKEQLCSDGVLYVATVQESLLRRVRNVLSYCSKKFIKRKQVNRYENNVFYKIGPRKYRSNRYIVNILAKAGFTDVSKKIIKKYPEKGIAIVVYVAKV